MADALLAHVNGRGDAIQGGALVVARRNKAAGGGIGRTRSARTADLPKANNILAGRFVKFVYKIIIQTRFVNYSMKYNKMHLQRIYKAPLHS